MEGIKNSNKFMTRDGLAINIAIPPRKLVGSTGEIYYFIFYFFGR